MVMKTKEQARANFEASVAYIPARYEAGIDLADWASKAKSAQAEKNYADGVSKAIANKSRAKGLAGVSNEDWKTAAKTKGAPIIGARILGALDKWETKWGPMYDSVRSKVAGLPPKTTDFMMNINNRLVPTVKAWKAASGKT